MHSPQVTCWMSSISPSSSTPHPCSHCPVPWEAPWVCPTRGTDGRLEVAKGETPGNLFSLQGPCQQLCPSTKDNSSYQVASLHSSCALLGQILASSPQSCRSRGGVCALVPLALEYWTVLCGFVISLHSVHTFILKNLFLTLFKSSNLSMPSVSCRDPDYTAIATPSRFINAGDIKVGKET